MLNLSTCTIRFAKSGDYLRLLLCIYSCALLAFFQSSFPLIFKMLAFIFLLLLFIQIARNPLPNLHYPLLSYRGGLWLLEDKKGQVHSFDSLRIVFDTGLFSLLEFKAEKKRKLLVIFTDQISKKEQRFLNILGRVN